MALIANDRYTFGALSDVPEEWARVRRRLSKYLKQEGLTRDEFGARVNMTGGAITLFIKGRRGGTFYGPSLALLVGIAQALGVSVDSLLPPRMRTTKSAKDKDETDSADSGLSGQELSEAASLGRVERFAEDLLVAVDRAKAQPEPKTRSPEADKTNRARDDRKSG